MDKFAICRCYHNKRDGVYHVDLRCPYFIPKSNMIRLWLANFYEPVVKIYSLYQRLIPDQRKSRFMMAAIPIGILIFDDQRRIVIICFFTF